MAAGEELQSCSTCGSTEKLLRCTSCKKVYYCGVKCQKQDLTRHRQEDGCGRGVCNGSKPSPANAPKYAERPHDTSYPPTKLAPSGPKCLRCAGPGEDVYADIVARSIFGSPDCKHGPYCLPCAEALQRLTLSFCSGCNALVQSLVYPTAPAEERVESQPPKIDIMSLD